MQTTRRPEFVTAAFERSHGRSPRGSGGWAFQASTRRRAFDVDLVGDVVFAPGGLTLSEAKASVAPMFDGVEFVAVLP